MLIEAIVVDDKLRQRDRLIVVDHAAGIVAVQLGTHESIDHSCIVVDMSVDMPSSMPRTIPFSQWKVAQADLAPMVFYMHHLIDYNGTMN